ncbi:MAG: TrmH family RNA methyltransferase [Candidatus Parcubacteria bacterium]|nr:TrmH family RNA methyltransferase [Candidatus Paceibacterota bacterium]
MTSIKSISFINPIIDRNKPRNVVDHLKWMSTAEINDKLVGQSKNFGLLLVNIDYDINTGTIIRAGNTFGAREVILYGRKKFDRRASVGAEFYTKFRQIEWEEQLQEVLEGYDVVIALENNLPNTVQLPEFKWDSNLKYLICVGQEGDGLPQNILDRCNYTLEIPSFGSVRSLNVGVAASIVMYDYISKISR